MVVLEFGYRDEECSMGDDSQCTESISINASAQSATTYFLGNLEAYRQGLGTVEESNQPDQSDQG